MSGSHSSPSISIKLLNVIDTANTRTIYISFPDQAAIALLEEKAATDLKQKLSLHEPTYESELKKEIRRAKVKLTEDFTLLDEGLTHKKGQAIMDIQSPLTILLKEKLGDFVANAFDANATEMQIILTSSVASSSFDISKLTNIQLLDNGTGFLDKTNTARFPAGSPRISYESWIVEGIKSKLQPVRDAALKIAASSVSSISLSIKTLQNKTIGGCGQALHQVNAIVSHPAFEGTLEIGNRSDGTPGAEIQISVPESIQTDRIHYQQAAEEGVREHGARQARLSDSLSHLNSSFALQNFTEEQFNVLTTLLDDSAAFSCSGFEAAKKKISTLKKTLSSDSTAVVAPFHNTHTKLNFTIEEASALRTFLDTKKEIELSEKLLAYYETIVQKVLHCEYSVTKMAEMAAMKGPTRRKMDPTRLFSNDEIEGSDSEDDLKAALSEDIARAGSFKPLRHAHELESQDSFSSVDLTPACGSRSSILFSPTNTLATRVERNHTSSATSKGRISRLTLSIEV